MFVVKRSTHNPLLKPILDHSWESFAAFNWCPVQKKHKVSCVYRAVSDIEYLYKQNLHVSTVGYTEINREHHFEKRRQLIAPEQKWEKFGCEDPRVTKIGKKYYIFYTALSAFPFSAEGIKVAVAITKDFKNIEERHLVTPFNAKAMVLFPEKIKGKYWAMLSAHTDSPPVITALAEFDSIEQIWSHEYWNKWHKNINKHHINLKRNDNDYIEIGSAPIKTKDGWLLIYSHIQNYFSDNKIFGIEAILMDLKDPSKIIARTSGPILVPEEIYEEFGQVPSIVFPSGAFIAKEKLFIYYGAADTTGCRAHVNVENLLDSMKKKPIFSRYENNPIIAPAKIQEWESKAVFNPTAIEIEEKIHILYRAMGKDDVSVLGYAFSENGLDILGCKNKPAYVPREIFETKGCEDPRITKIGDELYMFYTAFDGVNPPGVAATSIKVKDFLKQNWNWKKPAIITPVGIDNKDACLFPKKIKGSYYIIHRAHNHICFDPIKSLNFHKDKIESFTPIIGPRKGMWDSLKVGIAATPIETERGWLLFYHGVSDDGVYRVGAVLLQLDDPSIVLSRTTDFIFEPEMEYEKKGQVNNVVFPCGIINKKGTIFMYYGGGDSVVGVAKAKLSEILRAL